jgi:hypothetical protein
MGLNRQHKKRWAGAGGVGRGSRGGTPGEGKAHQLYRQLVTSSGNYNPILAAHLQELHSCCCWVGGQGRVRVTQQVAVKAKKQALDWG